MHVHPVSSPAAPSLWAPRHPGQVQGHVAAPLCPCCHLLLCGGWVASSLLPLWECLQWGCVQQLQPLGEEGVLRWGLLEAGWRPRRWVLPQGWQSERWVLEAGLALPCPGLPVSSGPTWTWAPGGPTVFPGHLDLGIGQPCCLSRPGCLLPAALPVPSPPLAPRASGLLNLPGPASSPIAHVQPLSAECPLVIVGAPACPGERGGWLMVRCSSPVAQRGT